MVKVAVAGGTGNVATEILRASIASGKHDITIFTRGNPPATSSSPNVSYKQIDYHNLPSLTEALKGFDVCLSFLDLSRVQRRKALLCWNGLVTVKHYKSLIDETSIVAHLDVGNTVQKNLIHACIDAGVRRFSPSEWAIKNNSGAPPYANKDAIASYLSTHPATSASGTSASGTSASGTDSPKLEYCLFQPSLFMDYYANPYSLSPNLITWPPFVDFHTRHAIVLDDGNQPLGLTAVHDVSAILALALDDARPWPTVGGMRGARTTTNELLALGQKLRGGEWTVERVRSEDINQGLLKTNWVPQVAHPVIPVAEREAFSTAFVIMFLKGIMKGCWDVGTQWNERFPEYEFMGLEEYLTRAWEGKP